MTIDTQTAIQLAELLILSGLGGMLIKRGRREQKLDDLMGATAKLATALAQHGERLADHTTSLAVQDEKIRSLTRAVREHVETCFPHHRRPQVIAPEIDRTP